MQVYGLYTGSAATWAHLKNKAKVAERGPRAVLVQTRAHEASTSFFIYKESEPTGSSSGKHFYASTSLQRAGVL